ncbi:MAG TPA: YbaK/EbsC family protein [Segeticoccus sp.]|uniref:YbaK/EbsC family protein n=1 Tax=Segeticoccus sp. TaxID=2706531 RepID=UPI002D7FEADA|nr:YbaK/EbsC family protein [Segeticoccus sp.]HET8600282.1 YbaK/EbsC family protein [Segeticoccus sp.]
MSADPAARDLLTGESVQRVASLLREFGVRGQVVALSSSARTARDAASTLGVEVAQIASSLVFRSHRADGTEVPVLVLTSGAHRVDTVKVAAALEVDELALADAAYVRRQTGFAIGGVAPVGHLVPMLTVVDVSLGRYATVWAAAGHPHAVFPTSYDELLRITGGTATEVA